MQNHRTCTTGRIFEKISSRRGNKWKKNLLARRVVGPRASFTRLILQKRWTPTSKHCWRVLHFRGERIVPIAARASPDSPPDDFPSTLATKSACQACWNYRASNIFNFLSLRYLAHTIPSFLPPQNPRPSGVTHFHVVRIYVYHVRAVMRQEFGPHERGAAVDGADGWRR